MESEVSTILKLQKSDQEDDLSVTKRKWKKLADLWIESKDIYVGCILVYFLRAEVMTHAKYSLKWRELEFVVTVYLLRIQHKLSNDETVLCDLLLSREYLENCILDFTKQFEQFSILSKSNKKLKLEYPAMDVIVDKFTHLRRFRSLVHIRELLQDCNQSSTELNNSEPHFIGIAKITELLLNKPASPHFPSLDEGSLENMVMPVAISGNMITRCRYVFGHMISLKLKDTSFEKLASIFKNLEPIINILLENEKRVVVMKFLNRAMDMEIEKFESEIEQFDEHNIPWFDVDEAKIEAHTKLVDNLIKKWDTLKNYYNNLNQKHVESGTLAYIREMLTSFRNLHEIMSNEFNDRINPLLIKIANFKLAQDDSSRKTIFENIKSSMKGYRNWYRYQKSLNIQQRISSVLFIMKKGFAQDEKNANILKNIEEIDAFFKFSDVERLPEYCAEFLKEVFNDNVVVKRVDKESPFSETGLKKFVEHLLSNNQIDQSEIKNILDSHWTTLKDHYNKLKSEGKLSVKVMEACFVTGTEIQQFMKMKPKEEIGAAESKMILDVIPILEGSALRNFIMHNNHLLLLLPYDYEELLKKNCEILFEGQEPKWDFTLNNLQPKTSCEQSKDRNELIKFGSIDELHEHQLNNPNINIQPDNLKFAIFRGDVEVFTFVLNWEGLELIIEEPLNKKKYTPFLLCCELGESQFVKLLIEKNCNVFAKSAFGYSCFHITAQRNQKDLFNELLGLKLKLNLNIFPIYQLLSETDLKYKPQHVGLLNGSVDVINLIKDLTKDTASVIMNIKTLNINSKRVNISVDWERKTVNTIKKIQFQIKDTTKQDTYYQINGEYGFECGMKTEEQPSDIESFWKLPKKQGKILYKTIESGHFESLNQFNDIFKDEIDDVSVFKLIEFQCTRETFDRYFNTYQNQHKNITLDNLATKNKNWSLLYTAIKYNNKQVIEYLTENMNDDKWKTKTNEGVTPLHLLFELKRTNKVKSLLKNKELRSSIFKDLKDHTAKSTGRSILHWIVLNRWDFCLKEEWLKEELRSIANEKDCFGETPLEYEKYFNNEEMVEQLSLLANTNIQQ